MLVLYVILLGVAACWWLMRSHRHGNSKLPPGPPRYPVVGNIFQVTSRSEFPAVALQELADIYGDVMYLELGAIKAVVFSSHNSIREILNHERSVDRAIFPVIEDRNMHQNLGLVWSNGEDWQTLRRFTIRNLRDFGFGKSTSMDIVINEEVERYAAHLRKETRQQENGVLLMWRPFDLPFLNILWRLVTGKSYDYDESNIKQLLSLQGDFFRSTDLMFSVSDAFPILRDMFPAWTMKERQVETSTKLYKYAEQVLQEHKTHVKTSGEARALLDIFAAKIKENEEKQESNSAFTDAQCVMTILDLLLGGSETSSNTMIFAVLYMLLNPALQDKVQAEIDANIPATEQITSDMKKRLPYTCATVLETFRYSTILPLPGPRAAAADLNFRGFSLKKGTVLMTNVKASHFDRKVWGDPENFRPERFLNEDGSSVDSSVEKLLDSFGAGKRSCMGQTLAEGTIFIFFTSLMRRFKFLPAEGYPEPRIVPIPSTVYTPHPFHLRIVERVAQ